MKSNYDVYMCRQPRDKFRINLIPTTLLRDYKLMERRNAEDSYELIKLPSMAEKSRVEKTSYLDFELYLLRLFALSVVIAVFAAWLLSFK